MTDKEKIREEVEKLKSNLIYGACSSQIAMETMCKEEACNEVLAILDTMQEEPKYRFNVGDKVQSVSGKIAKIESVGTDKYWCVGERGMSIPFKYQDQWELVEEPVSDDLEEAADDALSNVLNTHEIVNVRSCLEMFKLGAKWQKTKDESTTEDLGDYINELSKQFPEVSFAKLSRIAVRVAKWKVENLWKSADGDDLPEIDREVVALLDNGKVGFAHRPPEYWDGKNIITGKVTRNYPKTYDKGGWNIPNIKYWLDFELPKEIEL